MRTSHDSWFSHTAVHLRKRVKTGDETPHRSIAHVPEYEYPLSKEIPQQFVWQCLALVANGNGIHTLAHAHTQWGTHNAHTHTFCEAIDSRESSVGVSVNRASLFRTVFTRSTTSCSAPSQPADACATFKVSAGKASLKWRTASASRILFNDAA
jgi:hypothetical protein